MPNSVPEHSVVYAIGDIHGRDDLLARLHRAIVADAETRPATRRVVVYVGDYVDRGPASKAVIDRLIDDPLPGFEAVHLLGNHEDYFIRFLDDEGVGPNWFMNGGLETLQSYGVFADGHAATLASARRAFVAKVPAAHRRFLESLRLWHVEGGYAFVHAGLRPGVPLAEQDRETLIWIRDRFLDSTVDHGHVVVHGHTIRAAPEVRANRIGIDTGAFASGVLTALVLEGADRAFLQT